jgi:hypothetical protein
MPRKLDVLAEELLRCQQELRSLGADATEKRDLPNTLIISTGDVSDVDGFFALAEYAKTGASVLFIMNYPHYLRRSIEENKENEFGLGYTYDEETFLQISEALFKDEAKKSLYNTIKKTFEIFDMHTALTVMAMQMAKTIWSESGGEETKLFFCVGGINSINPFHANGLKNELFVYADEILPAMQKTSRVTKRLKKDEIKGLFARFSDIYMDFNGSMAFYDPFWNEILTDAAQKNKLKAVVMMGGVCSNTAPLTMPAIPGVLNRLSCATMNQLYHPRRTGNFFTMLKENHVLTIAVSNNDVGNFDTFANAEKTIKTDDGWITFLSQNNLRSEFLSKITSAYYHSQYNPPRRPFDYYTAQVMKHMINGNNITYSDKCMHFNSKYGATIISTRGYSSSQAVEEYTSKINTTEAADDIPFIKTKKQNFAKEKAILPGLDWMTLDIKTCSFKMSQNFKLDVDVSS